MLHTLSKLWSGDTPLPRALFRYALCYGTLLNLLTTFASLAVLAAGGAGVLALAVHLAPLPYNILMIVAVWRSSARYRGPAHWRKLARIGIVVWAIAATII